MDLKTIMGYLAPFEPLLKAEILKLEAQGKNELDAIIANVASPDLKLLLQTLVVALDSFAQQEIAKLG